MTLPESSTPSEVVAYSRILLYLCWSDVDMSGIAKAFAVTAAQTAPAAENAPAIVVGLSLNDLASILYRSYQSPQIDADLV